MIYQFDGDEVRNYAAASRREWLLTNGTGAYAMGTISGANTRRYHGHLVSSDRHLNRVVHLANIEATLMVDGDEVGLSTNQYMGAVFPEGYRHLESFSATERAVWLWRVRDTLVEKELTLHASGNGVVASYRNLGDKPVELILRPLVCEKQYHGNFAESGRFPRSVDFGENTTTINGQLVLHHANAERMAVQGWYYRFEYVRETERGLPSRDDLYCPCELRFHLEPGQSCALEALLDDVVGDGEIEKPKDKFSAAAAKFELQVGDRRSIIAGYPWFTDWGRDTMISLPGIYLCSGKFDAARQVLRSYGNALNRGLIPNRFVESGGAEYNTVDATLWFLHSAYLTLQSEWDADFAKEMFARGREIVHHHVVGTHYGIVVADDGLLMQGALGVQLTWMDAKIGEWVVTPRHGKPVEINGLWINALRIMDWLAERLGEEGLEFKIRAEQAEASFEPKFWSETLGFYMDTADPDDGSLRPNQLIAMALPFGPAKGSKAVRALERVSMELLTPYGLRTLGPKEPGYKGRFKGALPELDAAYHQGTVWPWLLGPYCDAVMKLTGNRDAVAKALGMVEQMLSEAGIDGISEVYDGDPPQTPGGCPWQAWSVAEIRRVSLAYLQG